MNYSWGSGSEGSKNGGVGVVDVGGYWAEYLWSA